MYYISFASLKTIFLKDLMGSIGYFYRLFVFAPNPARKALRDLWERDWTMNLLDITKLPECDLKRTFQLKKVFQKNIFLLEIVS